MKKLTFAIAGMGNRGFKYAEKQLEFPEDMEVVAIADTRPVRTETANRWLKLPEDRVFSSVEAMLEAPKLADVMIIATQDAQHKAHAIAAMEKGYDLILEKPIANHLEDCLDILAVSERLHRRVLVCHVLRYTPFYRTIKNLLKENRIGKVESIQAIEAVGYYHIAHSFVRGNWHRLEDSSPMILAKCCHDLDLLVWLTDRHCEKVSSFGSLDYFKAENAPEGAAERCLDCAVPNCPFHAPNFYLSRMPGWPTCILHPEPTKENVLEILKTSDYGKCVFHMNNDVVDHQIVNLRMDGGATAGLQMTGFTAKQDRSIRIMGTEGEIWGDFRSSLIHLQRFNEPEETFDVSGSLKTFSGHGGGDTGLIADAIRYFRNEDFDRTSITELRDSVESHAIAFAAEASRLQDGEVMSPDDFLQGASR